MSDKGQINIVVHDGAAHLDEVTALAICTLWLEQKEYSWEVIRSRELNVINAANIVFDVGQVYDPTIKRFDHHQKSFTLTRPNGIKYASAGLAWLHLGKDLCDDDEEVWNLCDAAIIQSIDALDNGITLATSVHPSGLMPFSVSHMFSLLQATFDEDPDINHDAVWLMMEQMRSIIPRLVIHMRAKKVAKQKVIEAYENAIDKRIVVLDEPYPWFDTLVPLAEPLLVVYPRADGSFGVECVRKELSSFETRISLPTAWRGIAQEELQTISEVSDAIFCHVSGFKCAAKSFEGAMMMALKAIDEYELVS